MEHIPVLLEEAVNGLRLSRGAHAIDCTLGDGGHTIALQSAVGPEGKICAIDIDPGNIALFKRKHPSALGRVMLVHDNFVHLKEIIARAHFTQVNGILLDLGWSMRQFTESGRGFSFAADEPLDMRLGGAGDRTAAGIVNEWSEKELGDLLRRYGEEPRWRQIALAIVQSRRAHPIKTTYELVRVIESVKKRYGALHPATQTFQALRIAVNRELENLEGVLPQAVEALAPGGRVAVISFHSLEDRIVKRFFQKQKDIEIITKKPIIAGREEIKNNPRARSAKLRIAQKKQL